MSKWIKHITHPGGDVKFLFEWWKIFHSWAQRSFLHAKSAGKGLWEFVRRHLGSASDWFAGGAKFFACCNFIRFKFFFIFRTINSILIHKLNYKEHNEKRKNMYKLNSCLVFFCLFVGVKIQRKTSIITRWPGLANFPMRKTRIILLTVIHTLIQTCRFVAFVFHLCFVVIFSLWNAPHNP